FVFCSVVIAIGLLYYGFFALRHFHPFPTRRSSDLRVDAETQDLLTKAAALAGMSSLNSFVLNAAIEKAKQVIEREQVLKLRTNEDRKSTRLNSSHVKISYAVFCLKKKIRN